MSRDGYTISRRIDAWAVPRLLLGRVWLCRRIGLRMRRVGIMTLLLDLADRIARGVHGLARNYDRILSDSTAR